MKRQLKVDIGEFDHHNFYTKEDVIKHKSLFFTANGVPSMIGAKWLKEEKLFNLMSSLLFYTKFLKNEYSIGLRFYCVEHNLTDYPKCKCGKEIKKVFNNKQFNKFCSQNCANQYTNYEKENVYGEEMSKKIWDTRRSNGKGLLTADHKNKLSNVHLLEETKEKFKKTCIAKYGVENPGVLGAYFSKSGLTYIKKFIIDNHINEKLCYYKGGGINENEYFQMIYDPKKQKQVYFSYDLVVFKNENLKEIELVFEYNGSWHHSKQDVEKDPNSPGHPYKNNVMTKKEIYEHDILKLEHIKQKCKNILIYWEKTKQLQRYEECY
jgi:hypothetical protein